MVLMLLGNSIKTGNPRFLQTRCQIKSKLLHLRSGRAYLAVSLDLHPSRVVVSALEPYMRETPTIEALEAALGQRKPESGTVAESRPRRAIPRHHYQQLLTDASIRRSMI